MVDSRVAIILDTLPSCRPVLPGGAEGPVRSGGSTSQPDLMENWKRRHILHDGFLSEDNRTFYLAAQTDNWMAAIDVAEMKIARLIDTGAIPPARERRSGWNGVRGYHLPGRQDQWDEPNVAASNARTGPVHPLAPRQPCVWADRSSPSSPTPLWFRKGAVRGGQNHHRGKRTLHPEFTQNGDASTSPTGTPMWCELLMP